MVNCSHQQSLFRKSILLFNQQFLVYKLKFVELVEQCYIVWTWKQSQTLKSQSKRR
jgi:hypothetical protein